MPDPKGQIEELLQMFDLPFVDAPALRLLAVLRVDRHKRTALHCAAGSCSSGDVSLEYRLIEWPMSPGGAKPNLSCPKRNAAERSGGRR